MRGGLLFWRQACALPKRCGDGLAVFALTAGVFALYTQTLAPSLLDGDPGLFQYVAATLGIPYPPGFPLYILLGYLWTWLPVGTLAYRMNLFSACFGALTVGALFMALRRQRLNRWIAGGGALTLAVLPPFWQYATVAAEYTLHTFLTVLLFIFLNEWEQSRQPHWLALGMLTLGLGLSNHPTFALLIPALAIYVLSVGGLGLLKQTRVCVTSLLLVAAPLLLYLYFPLRGHDLVASSPELVLPAWSKPVAQGIVSPFYQDNPAGWLAYWTAAAFVKNVASQGQWQTGLVNWGRALLLALNGVILVAASAGLVGMARRRTKLALAFLVTGLTLQLVIMQYVQAALANVDDFTPYLIKFFLPGLIAIIVFAAWGFETCARMGVALLTRVRVPKSAAAVAVAIFALGWFAISTQELVGRYSHAWVERSGDVEARWRTVQRFAPEVGAALVGHWGDLTPLWYLQNAEGWRRDLIAIYPPTEQPVGTWLAMGKPLYLAGALLEWAPGIAKNYQLTPWGNLVRVSAISTPPPNSPLPAQTEWRLNDAHPVLRLLGSEMLTNQVRAGESFDVAVYWEAAGTMALEDYVVYLALSDPETETAKHEFGLVVNWFPRQRLDANQRALSVYRYPVPPQTAPGEYALRLFVYSIQNAHDLTVADPSANETRIHLGALRVTR